MTKNEWKQLQVGDVVIADTTIYDLPPNESFIHAGPGDFGIVVNIEPGHITVEWHPNKTTTDVHWKEIRNPKKIKFKTSQDIKRLIKETK